MDYKMAEEPPPLLLCMENMKGEEVTLAISPNDDFNTFLAKAKLILGFDVDLNSVTKNHPVQLTDNIYQFLIQNEAKTDPDTPGQTLEEMLEQSSTDLVYILDDGTQINASQIHFDNDDPFTDLTKEPLPFIKYNDTADDLDDRNLEENNTKKINILASPVLPQNSGFINSIPFKLVCSNTSGFEAQFIKHLQGKTYTTLNTVVTKKSPKTLINDNYKRYINEVKKSENLKQFSREDVVNMLKDSPVIPNITKEKRRHTKKTTPAPVFKKAQRTYADLPYFPIGNLENQDCFICSKFVDNTRERLYIFDKEDQKLHRSSPQKRRLTQLKILCESCLNTNFQHCPNETQTRVLNSDEYLIIRNNQQYIYQLINPGCFQKDLPVPEVTEVASLKEQVANLKETANVKDAEVAVVKEEQIIDIEIIDQGTDIDEVIENLEEADEDVKVFLGKYQKSVDKELVCRFCHQKFTEISQVISHGSEHRHDLDDGEVYPCPLCDYGYANFKWLKGHIKTAHEKSETSGAAFESCKTDNFENSKEAGGDIDKTEINNANENNIGTPHTGSPIARRTRSSAKKSDDNSDEEVTEMRENENENKENNDSNIGKNTTQTDSHVISTEVKQECLDSDEAIWIAHTDDSDLDQQANKAQDVKKKKDGVYTEYECLNCKKMIINSESSSIHKCFKTKANKRKSISDDDDIICIPSKQDFLKRAQGRVKKQKNDTEKMDGVKNKNFGQNSNSNIVTCNDCNENFTSKVRLKFHMQFHAPSPLLTADGQYRCSSCRSSFPLERALFDHVHFRHPPLRRWQCPLPHCRKTFRLRATLTKHSRVHTDTRRYACAACGKRFLDKQTLDEHSVTHLQTKPFQCHICMKQLTRRSRLRMHLKAHEELTQKALLVCVHCHRAFRDEAEAEEHAETSSTCLYEVANELKQESDVNLSPSSGVFTKTMSPMYPRSIPRQASPSLSEPLLRGLREPARALTRVALADRVYRCEYCEDVYYSEEGLNKHRVIHKGVKNPFTCHICKVSFATYSRCTTHKTTHGFYKRPVEMPDSETKPGTAQNIVGYGDFPVAKHFLCEECGRSYLHWTYLQVHRRMKHGAADCLYRCNDCHLTFPNTWSVTYHRKKAHGKTSSDAVNGVTKISKTDYRIPCRDCEEFLPNKTALYRHRNKEHSDLSLLSDKPGVFWCMSCGVKFQSQSAMAAHDAQCGEGGEGTKDELSKTGPREGRARPQTVLVMEFEGLEPSPEVIMATLTQKNVNLNKIIDINKISIPKGVKSVVPSTERALRFISSRQKKEKDPPITADHSNQTSSLENSAQTSNEIDAQTDNQADTQPASSANTREELSDINVSMLLQDVASTNQGSPLQFDETLLLN